MVSIIIPVYNGANYLRRAIESALSQTYLEKEIIVVNDGSNDNGKTEQIALSYGDRIRYIKKTNGGVSSALNLGIREMKGDYFSWLSHDDEYHPKKVEMQIKLLNKYSEKYLALCGTEFIDVNDNKIEKTWKMPKKEMYSPKEILEEINKYSLSGIALLIPRQALLNGGCFDESLRFTQDKALWKNIFLEGYSLVVDHDIYAKSRLHGEQQTNLHRNRFKEEMERTEFDFSKRYLECGYNELLKYQWYTLLKNEINLAAKKTEELMEKENLMDFETRTRGSVYKVYGRIRPFIRHAYYKLKFGISSQEGNEESEDKKK